MGQRGVLDSGIPDHGKIGGKRRHARLVCVQVGGGLDFELWRNVDTPHAGDRATPGWDFNFVNEPLDLGIGRRIVGVRSTVLLALSTIESAIRCKTHVVEPLARRLGRVALRRLEVWQEALGPLLIVAPACRQRKRHEQQRRNVDRELQRTRACRATGRVNVTSPIIAVEAKLSRRR